MSDFDCVVVGSGIAGPVAAYELAQAGKSVLVIERGEFPGAKNMSGGRLYTHSLHAVFPNFRDSAPLERRIVRERITFLAPDAAVGLDYTDSQLSQVDCESYSVLRARFDPWLAAQAEEAGAEYITSIPVEALVMDGSRVTGVKAGSDEITADVVILCDGVNSLLVPNATNWIRPNTVAVGIKQVIQLPAGVITDRFAAPSDNEGTAWLFVGDATKGRSGGGFIYTNKDTISLGLVVMVSDLMTSGVSITQMIEDFKAHIAVAPMIAGGTVVEHSGHLVAEGGYDAMPPLAGDGFLIAGDAAMMCVNAGYTVRGMDFAVAAGMYAGRTAAAALEAGDTSVNGLANYQASLEDSFVLQDLKRLRRFPAFMETTPRLFEAYPMLARDVMRQLFVVDGKPVRSIRRSLPTVVKQVGFRKLGRDLWRGMRSL